LGGSAHFSDSDTVSDTDLDLDKDVISIILT
jgi:hypothetical protein